ncbi:MAG: hypothetical protein A2114_01390 [Candidatus Vogelbacteria bacterium GWA1_51_14]|uniref:PrgI family protein n=1 Tax=Candidatus Vogelbacteria bacterium GWA1_51_14 TaxID=1802435 RepID=A0A1G2Q9X0_9BACT|nr:MAG: hypothetical protein A2114_01390 [Candidatus Vogelbacteria bacterium GWA1_51_14]
MNFQVPQFIEIEDKIFGPLSLKQFLYVVGGAGLSFLFYAYLPLYLAIFPIAIVAGLAIMLAFYKYNERPFVVLIEAAIRYLLTNKLYIWRKEDRTAAKAAAKVEPITIPNGGGTAPRLSTSRLKDLSWSLDVKDVLR